MLSKASLKKERRPSKVKGSSPAAIGNRSANKKTHVAGVTGNKTRVEQAEARAEQAETRTEQAKTRAELAESRTEKAEARTEQAETRTELAKTRTEQAEIRTEQAETTLQRVVHGDAALHRGISTRLLKKLPLDGVADPQNPVDQLTSRQREILLLIAEGQNTKQIAEILKVSPKTVEYHRMKLMDCLDVHDIPGLVRLALRVGLIPSES
jgi:DNA-binding CsgD family transcriptional regulator